MTGGGAHVGAEAAERQRGGPRREAGLRAALPAHPACLRQHPAAAGCPPGAPVLSLRGAESVASGHCSTVSAAMIHDASWFAS